MLMQVHNKDKSVRDLSISQAADTWDSVTELLSYKAIDGETLKTTWKHLQEYVMQHLKLQGFNVVEMYPTQHTTEDNKSYKTIKLKREITIQKGDISNKFSIVETVLVGF